MKVVPVVLACVLILGVGVYMVLPLISEKLIERECSQTDPTHTCVARMRAAGHVLSQRGDLLQAKNWYLRAAKHGDQIAMFHLAWVYEELAHKDLLQYHHSGSEQETIDNSSWNILESVRLQKAIEDSSIPLALKVGGDWQLARTWYLQSANLDFSPSMNNLARLYSLGLGGAQNPRTANFWFLKAVNTGNPVSVINLNLTTLEVKNSGIEEWGLDNWIPTPGRNQEIAEPTLERTKGLGFDMPLSTRTLLRETAEKGEAIRISDLLSDPTALTSSYGGIRTMQPNPHLPTFDKTVHGRDGE